LAVEGNYAMEAMKPKVSIIILNWNGWKDTVECLESLYRIDYPNYDVIVVDNGSTDDSIEKIKEYCEGKIAVESKFFKYEPSNKPIEVVECGRDDRLDTSKTQKDRLFLIKNDKNYGFAKGNNIGIQYALKAFNPDYILLLNNDTVVDRNFLTELVKLMESDGKIGIAGPKIYYYDFNGRSDVISFTGEDIIPEKGSGKRYGCGEIDSGQWDRQMEVDRLEGSCMLIRREVFERIGLLDEDYFLYWEETDFCIRAKKAGFKVVYCPKARIWHKVSASAPSNLKLYFLTKNRFLFIAKNFPEVYRRFIFYYALYRLWLSVIGCIYRRNFGGLKAIFRGTIDGYRVAKRYRLRV
jgi:GT2 family glycosyltransferase